MAIRYKSHPPVGIILGQPARTVFTFLTAQRSFKGNHFNIMMGIDDD